MFYAEFVVRLTLYVYADLRKPSSNGSLIIATKFTTDFARVHTYVKALKE
jgi:hypothetical protein